MWWHILSLVMNENEDIIQCMTQWFTIYSYYRNPWKLPSPLSNQKLYNTTMDLPFHNDRHFVQSVPGVRHIQKDLEHQANAWTTAPSLGSRDGAVVRALASHQCGYRPCFERFFSGYSGFPLSSKTNISKFQYGLESLHCPIHWHLHKVILKWFIF